MIFAPVSNLFAYPLVQRTTVDHSVLEFPAGRIRCFYQNKQTFVLFFADFDKWFDTVRTQIWINSSKIFIKSIIAFGTNLNFSQMTYGICLRCRTDISSLYISDYNKTFLMAVIYRFLECFQSLDTKLFIHGHLWLYSRNQIISSIYNCLVELPDSFCSSFQCLTVLRKSTCLDMFRHIIQHGIQSDYDRCMSFLNFFN